MKENERRRESDSESENERVKSLLVWKSQTMKHAVWQVTVWLVNQTPISLTCSLGKCTSVRNIGRQLDISINCNMEYAIINLRFHRQHNNRANHITYAKPCKGMQKCFHIDRNWLCNRSLLHYFFFLYSYPFIFIFSLPSSPQCVFMFISNIGSHNWLSSILFVECIAYTHTISYMKCKNLIFIHQFQFGSLLLQYNIFYIFAI